MLERGFELDRGFLVKVAEEDLETFIELGWKAIEPGRPFVNGWHIGAICEHLQAVSAGEIRRLILNVPPRHMKSLAVSVFWPVWHWRRNAVARWIFSSYAAELSLSLAIKRRTLIDSAFFQRNWPSAITAREDENRKASLINTAGGSFRSTSTGGTVGGQGGDFVVIDDPQNPATGASKADREAANLSTRYLAGTRLDDPKTGRVVLIQQRLHYEDQTSTLEKLWQESGEPYTKVSLPSPASKPYRVFMPISKVEREVKAGEALWPERFGQKEIERIRIELGPYGFAEQFGQSPTPEGGGTIKIGWFGTLPSPPKGTGRSGWFWDTAFKESQDADFSVGIHVLEFDRGFYIADLIRRQVSFPDLLKLVKAAFNARPATVVGVEDKASGQDLIATVSRETNLPLWAYQPKGDKVFRVSLATPTLAAGRIWLPSDAPWAKTFLDEMLSFPRGANDDQVDALTMAIFWFMTGAVSKIGKDEASATQSQFSPPTSAKDLW